MSIIAPLNDQWLELLKDEFEKDYMKTLTARIEALYEDTVVYPPREQLFHALNLTSFDSIKAVILGQDPYHGPNQAYGLSFSVKEGVRLPPSLRNIYKELESDIGCSIPKNGELDKWAREGVLLLNTVLTVEAGKAAAHQKFGWEKFTDQIISLINERNEPVVFILWGKQAIDKKKMIDTTKHYVLESVHPSPLSAHRGFFGSKPFSQTNQFLQEKGIAPIDWRLTE